MFDRVVNTVASFRDSVSRKAQLIFSRMITAYQVHSSSVGSDLKGQVAGKILALLISGFIGIAGLVYILPELMNIVEEADFMLSWLLYLVVPVFVIVFFALIINEAR